MTTIRAEKVRIPGMSARRPLREALGLLSGAARPDSGFTDDMEAVLADIGPAQDNPWVRS